LRRVRRLLELWRRLLRLLSRSTNTPIAVAVETTVVVAVVSTVAVVEMLVPPAKTLTDLSNRLETSLSPAENTVDVESSVATVEISVEKAVVSTADREVAREVVIEAVNVEIVVAETAPRRRELLSLLSNNSNLNNE
jgi:hypothetical protein